MPRPLSKALACSSLRAVVTIEMFIPASLSTLLNSPAANTTRPALPQLERRERLLRFRDHWLLSGDGAQFVGSGVENLVVADGLAHTHVDDDFLEARHRHGIRNAKLLGNLRRDVFLISIF